MISSNPFFYACRNEEDQTIEVTPLNREAKFIPCDYCVWWGNYNDAHPSLQGSFDRQWGHLYG